MNSAQIIILIIFLLLIVTIICLAIYVWYKNRPVSKLTELSGSDSNLDFRCTIPKGTWQNTCQGGSVSGSILTANCLDSKGSVIRSSLDLNLCDVGDVFNSDGNLTCYAGTGLCNSNRTCAIPTGKFQQSCTNIRVDGSMLYADCPSSNGIYQPTYLDLRNCGQGDIINVDGTLRCSAGTGLC